MKKSTLSISPIIVLSALILLMAFMLAACGNDNSNNDNSANANVETNNDNELTQAFEQFNNESSAEDRTPEMKISKQLMNSEKTSIDDYEQARKVFWRKLYNRGGETLYCAEQFGSGYNKGINIEHVFPMSWVTNSLQCGKRDQCRRNSDRFNQIESDLHNLYPALSDINYERSSIAFGMVNGEQRNFGSCDFEISQRPRLVEPRDAARGEIARAMFYMVNQYPELMLFDKQIKTLKQWNDEDPVSKDEKRRNDIIEQVQGNRNPFIDNPALIDKTF